jgi:hypothetical protein
MGDLPAPVKAPEDHCGQGAADEGRHPVRIHHLAHVYGPLETSAVVEVRALDA